MKNVINKFLVCLTVVATFGFASCENSNEDFPAAELTIQEKVTMLESKEWLLKGFEDRVMHTFDQGARKTYYGTDSVFGEAIPGTEEYTIEGSLLKVDYNFGNVKTYEVKFSCNNQIVEFYENGVLNSTMYERNSNYLDCL